METAVDCVEDSHWCCNGQTD